MKKENFKSRFLILLLGFLTLSLTQVWAGDVVYKTALFGSTYNSKGVSSYTGSFSSTNNGFKVDLSNFNNNNNSWSTVKTGNKTNASVGTITTNAAIDLAVKKVVVTIDAITDSKVNSITLYTGSSASACTTSVGTFNKATGAQSVTISSPAASKFYKIAFDCAKGSSNGLITVSKVEYYVAGEKIVVTLDPNYEGATTPYETVEAEKDSDMPDAAAKMPSRDDFTLLGFFEKNDGTGKKYYNADGTSANKWDKSEATSIYAQWESADKPAVNISGTVNDFSYRETQGPATAQSVKVSGSNLTDQITVTASENFEVCLTQDGTYSSSINLTLTDGAVAATDVYVRMKANLTQAASPYAGKLTAASGSTQSQINLSGTVSEAPLSSMAQVIAGAKEGNAMTIAIDNWVVTGATTSTAYIADKNNEKGITIYKSGHGFTAGDVLNGTVSGVTSTYYNSVLPELTNLVYGYSGLEVTQGGSVTAKEKTFDDFAEDDADEIIGTVVTLKNVVYNSTYKTLDDPQDGENKYIYASTSLFSGASWSNEVHYNTTGVYSRASSSGGYKEYLNPRSAADIEEAGCETKVAISKAATTNGSFTISADQVCADGDGGEVTVTPSPNTNYEVDQVTTAPSYTVSGPVEGVYTVSGIKAATTISVTFKEKANASITWSLNGETPQGGTSKVYVGGKVSELPAVSSEYDCNGKKFVGWTNQPVTDGYKPGVLFTTAAAAPTITAAGEVTYYAVFATEQSTGGDPVFSMYEAVSTAPADWSGTYIMVVNGKYVELNGAKTSEMQATTTLNAQTEYASKEVSVAKTTNGYSIFLKENNKYLGKSGTSTSFGMNATYSSTDYDWSLSTTGIQSVATDTRYAMASGEKVAVYIPSSSYDYVTLYKRVETSGKSYTDYATTCQPTTYFVAFEGNGATSGSMDTIKNITKGDSQKLPANDFTKTGYDFLGWAETADGEKKYNDEATLVNFSSDSTLYAKWSAKVTGIILNKNNGTKDGYAVVAYDGNEVLFDSAAVWAKHLLLGYSTLAEGGDTIINGVGGLNANKAGYTTADGKWCNTSSEITLYAQWQEIQNYTITNNLTGCTADGSNPTEIDPDATDVTLNYTLSEGFEWTGATIVVMMGMTTLTDSEFDFDAGMLYIAPTNGFTGNVSVTITCKEELYVKLMDTNEKLDIVYGWTELPNRTCKNTDYTFYGWSKTDCGTTDTETIPTIVTTSEGWIEVTESMNLWPVFKKSENKTVWVKTTASAVEAATYAVITTDGYAFNGTINSSGHGEITSTAFSFTNDTATSAPSNTCEITMKAVTGGYTMYNADKGYLYATKAGSGGLAWHSTEDSYWSWASSNWKYNSNGAYLRDYQNTTIRTYGSNNGSLIQFAKKVTSGATYYNRKPVNVVAAPVFAPATGSFYGSVEVSISAGATDTIHYTIDGSEPTAASPKYTAPFTLTETKTVKAIAIDEDNYSSPVDSAKYTVYKVFTSIEDLVSANPVNDSVQLTLTDAYVHAVQSTGSNELVYLQKGNRGIVLSDEYRLSDLVAGKQLTATIRGMYKMSAGREQLNGYYFVGDPTISAGTRPDAYKVTAALDDNLMSRHLGLVKADSVFAMTKEGSNYIIMNTKSDSTGITYKLYNVLNVVKTLPDRTLACDVKGLFYRRVDGTETIYTIMPVQDGDFAVRNPQPALLPTMNPEGGATLAEAVSVPSGQKVTIIPVAGYTTYYTVKDGSETKITASKAEVTLDKDTFITVRATRDYYTEATATYYYKIDQSISAHSVTLYNVGSYTFATDKPSATQGETVTLTIIPNQHWYIDSVKAAYNTSDSIKCNSIGENKYTFLMPNADVKIRVFAHKDPMYPVSYLKGGKTTTGEDPQGGSYYENAEVTVATNKWSAEGYKFTGWKVTYNNGTEDVEITPVDNKFNMPPYAVKITAQWDEYIWHKPGDWVLVKSASDLAIGDYVIFADTLASNNKAAGTQNTNYRNTVDVTKSNDTLTFTTAPAKFLIEAGNVENTFAFLDEGVGYLNASGTGTNNHLTSTASKTSDNASFEVKSIRSTDGRAIVKAKSTNRNWLELNGSRFSAYGSKQSGLAIYKFYRTCKMVTFAANAGTDVVTNMPATQKADPVTNKVTLTSQQPERVGYTFTGWNTQQAGGGTTYVAGTTYTLENNVKLNAQWSVKQYNLAVAAPDYITIKAKPYAEDTIFEGNNADVNYNKSVALFYTDLDKAWLFKSWKVTEVGNESNVVPVTDGHFNMPAFAVNVTAVLESKATAKRTLIYDKNGGELIDPSTPTQIEYDYGTTIHPLAGTIFQKANCVFTGWNTQADGQGTSYVSGGQLTIYNDVTLYAQWQGLCATYTVQSKTSVEETSGMAPKGSTATFNNTYSGTYTQMTSGNSMTLTLKGYAGKIITGVSLSTKSNSGSGAGTYEVKLGDKTLYTVTGSYKEIFGAWATQFVTRELPIDKAYVEAGDSIVIKISASESSLHCQSFTITYADPTYKRENLTNKIGTLCLPKAVNAGDYFGARFYEIDYVLYQGSDPYKVYFAEVDQLQAGYPYVYELNEGCSAFAMIENGAKATAQSCNGLVGTLDTIQPAADNALVGNYMVVNNTFRLCGENNGLAANRAYLDLSGDHGTVPMESQAAPGRRRLVLTNQQATTPTGVEMHNAQCTMQDVRKVIIDNQMFIIRGGKMYNASGALVK